MRALPPLFPLFRTLEGYSRGDLRADAVAGFTTSVMLVPQGMAYALLAGLPPIHGVYAALIPAVVYAFIGTSRQLSVGPVALDSLLVAASVSKIAEAGSESYVAAAVLLALLVGAIQVTMGLLRMGFLVNFLSVPVISGFTSAAAVIIALSQAQHLLGVRIGSSPALLDLVREIYLALPNTDHATLGIGILLIAVLFGIRRFAPRVPAALVAVSLGAALMFVFGLSGKVDVVGTVPPGLPGVGLPRAPFELVQNLLPTALMIATIAFTESISVGKAYAKKNKYRVNPDRELIALGLGNAAGSLFGGYPVAGGLSRTAVSAEAGARTTVAGLIAALGVALSLVFFTPLFQHVPKVALAAIVVTAVVGLMDIREVVHLHKVKKVDMALLLLTFTATLSFGILPGIGVGVGASLLWFVMRTSRPHVAVLGRVPGTNLFRSVSRNRGLITYEGVIVVRMDAQFYFGNVDFLRSTLEQLEDRMRAPLRAVVLDFSSINSLDSSAESALGEMVSEYKSRGVALYLAGVKGPVADVLRSSGLWELLGQAGRCLTVHEAVTLINSAPQREGVDGATLPPTSAGVRASSSSARL